MITHDDIATLNAARDVLDALEERATKASFDAGPWEAHGLGRLAEIADSAEYAIFQTLNVASTRTATDMTEDELHNRKPEAVAADAS